MLRRARLSVAAVVILGLGIGASTAIFSVVNEVLLRPLPLLEPDRLVMVWSVDKRVAGGRLPVTPGDYRDYRAETRSFAGMAANRDYAYNVTGGGEPEMLIGYQVAAELFPLLGVKAAVGRAFGSGDGERVVVLSDELWQRRFGGDRGVVGRSVLLNQESYTVVGVMPATFQLFKRAALFTPLVIPADQAGNREARYLRIVARLAPGATVASARGDLAAVASRLAAAYPDSDKNIASDVVSLADMETADIRTPLLVLSGAVAFLLLLACANVAAVLLARAVGRQRELAIRVALGASRGRLVRQLLGETLVTVVAGGVLALLLASWSTSALLGLFPRHVGNIDVPAVDDIHLDASVIGFSLLLAAACVFLCGLPSALGATSGDLEQVLRAGTTGEPPRAARLRRWIVAGELALATLIATSAGLLMRSSLRLASAELGFDGRGVLGARLFLSEKRYPTPGQQRQLVADILARLRAQPGVASAGAVSVLPLSGWRGATTLRVEGRPGDELEAGFFIADAGYFETLGIPLLAGRLFDDGDSAARPAVALLDDGLARRLFPAGDALGKRLDLGSAAEPDRVTVVGIVGAVKESGPAKPARPSLYVATSQRAWPLIGLVARARDGRAAALGPALRAATWAVDPDQPLSYVLTMDEMRADVLRTARAVAFLFSAFAALALVLGVVGVYGVTANLVVRRTREIGVRMALGAGRVEVLGWIFRQTAGLIATGLTVGLGLSLALTRVLASQLHGVSATDPLVIASVCAALALAALAATGVPARRATRVDPLVALRAE